MKAGSRYSSKTTLVGLVPDGVGDRHRVLPLEAESPGELGVPGGEHPAVARGDDLPGVEREAGHRPVRPTDALPGAVPLDLAAERAGRVLDHGQAAGAGDPEDALQVAGKAELVHAQHGARARRERLLEPGRVEAERVFLDIHEDGTCAHGDDRVRRGDEAVAHRDHVVPGTHADGRERQLQRHRAIGDRDRVRRAHRRGELRLEGRDLGALGQPARAHHACGGLRLGFAEVGPHQGHPSHRLLPVADANRRRRAGPRARCRADACAPPGRGRPPRGRPWSGARAGARPGTSRPRAAARRRAEARCARSSRSRRP